MTNADLIRTLEKDGVFAFEQGGFVCRVLDASDDNSRRHDVEIFAGLVWVALVVESLDWRRELPGELAKFSAAWDAAGVAPRAATAA